MKQKLIGLSQRYVAALRKHLKPGTCTGPADGTALRLGREAVTLGLETLELARIHERALASLAAFARNTSARLKRAGHFFILANAPIEETHRAAIGAARLAIVSPRPVAPLTPGCDGR